MSQPPTFPPISGSTSDPPSAIQEGEENPEPASDVDDVEMPSFASYFDPQQLSITYRTLSSDDIAVLTTLLSSQVAVDGGAGFTAIELNGNQLGPDEIISICEKWLPIVPKLRMFDLSDNRAQPSGARAIREALITNCPAVEEVNLDSNNIQNEGARECAFLLRDCEALRSLSLVTNGITFRGISPLADGLVQSTAITTLLLDFNAIGDRGAVTLADALRQSRCPATLRRLGLSDNSIGCEGAIALAGLLCDASCAITTLNLSVNKIGPSGAEAFSAALQHPQCRLQSLDIACNPLGPDGRRAMFSNIANFAKLALLDVTSVEATDDEFQMIIAKLAPTVHGGRGVREMHWFNNPLLAPSTEESLFNLLENKQRVFVAEVKEKEKDDTACCDTRGGYGVVRATVAAVAAALLGVLAWRVTLRRSP